MIRKYHIYGLVQGVGFRPFVCDWCNSHGLTGYVKNDGGIVTVELSGLETTIDEFCEILSSLDGRSSLLPGAMVDRLELVGRSQSSIHQNMDDQVAPPDGFRIVESTDGSDELRMLPPDIATCPKCVDELFDPANRRFRHPFISCTACGPRYTIMTAVPYDRQRTTMDSFPVCKSCKDEYAGRSRSSVHRNSGRFTPTYPVRHFAQTICCNDCGPVLLAYDGRDEARGEEAFTWAVEVIRDGGIVAVKDVGGYHFCYDATNTATEERMREWKNRERKPFAVMFRDIDEIKKYACVSKTEEQLLTSPIAPIVLLDTYSEDGSEKNCSDVAHRFSGGRSGQFSNDRPENRIGAFLPSNPLQHMLLREVSPLVMTSGNRGGEPIITDDDEMKKLLTTGVPDLMLFNDRKILYGLDDSIFQVTRIPKLISSLSCDHVTDSFVGKKLTYEDGESMEVVQVIRRARSLVPEPVWIGRNLEADTLAAGGDLKSVFALGRKNAIYLSGHFGDLDDIRCINARNESIDHMSELLGIAPKEFICDKHPLYHSSADTLSRNGDINKGSMMESDPDEGVIDTYPKVDSSQNVETQPIGVKKVQHHFAHILSVAAEHDLKGRILGVAFDGTGYGDDETIWGGEFLLCDMEDMSYRRAGYLLPVDIIGGDDSARDARKTAFSYLYAGEKRGIINWSKNEQAILKQALDKNINTVKNSSMGRLFDGAAAILDICHENSFEGECPMMLQYTAERFAAGGFPVDESGTPLLEFPITEVDGAYVADTVTLLSDLYKKYTAGISAEALAFGFHRAVADMTIKMCARIAKEAHVTSVALSGGSMQNALLLKLIIPGLMEKGFKVYTNRSVPPGDGGLALGQIYGLTV